MIVTPDPPVNEVNNALIKTTIKIVEPLNHPNADLKKLKSLEDTLDFERIYPPKVKSGIAEIVGEDTIRYAPSDIEDKISKFVDQSVGIDK